MEVSKTIEQFLKLIDDCNSKYSYYFEIVGNCDKKTTDYLHALELENLKYIERAKLATEERNNLKERRKAKDIVEKIEPIKNYLENSDNKKAINLLRQLLGTVRKVEDRHKNRYYIKRVKE